jgi:hypothetical protein
MLQFPKQTHSKQSLPVKETPGQLFYNIDSSRSAETFAGAI